MRPWLPLAFVVLVSACAAPLAPAPAPVIVVPAAATIALTVSGPTSAHESLLNVTVTDATGKGVLGATVTLTTTAGTLNHSSVTTSPNGTAQIMLTTTADATVTARIDALVATVAALAYHVPEPPPPSVFVPPPPPVVVPPPPSCPSTPSLCPAPTLAVLLTCTPLAHGTPTPCNVNVTYGGTALPATAITTVGWNWGDGFADTTVPPTAPINSRSYATAGNFTVFATVTATTVDGAKTATASKPLVIP